jgi:DNA-binding Lrp family transcriptional regulator
LTESELNERLQEEQVMTKGDDVNYESKLSPSARALLRFVMVHESGETVDIFQNDAETLELKRMLSTHRGSLLAVLTKRLEEVVGMGGVSIISQRDVMSVIRTIWEENISSLSRTELPFLSAALKNLAGDIAELAKASRLSYAQARRCHKRLTEAGVLKIGGMLNHGLLGLERIAVIMENPSLILSGPHITHTLVVDAYSNLVLSIATVPYRNRSDFVDAIRIARGSTSNTTIWSILPGKPRFNPLYFKNSQWKIDALHLRLVLRSGGAQITLASASTPSTAELSDIRESDLRIMGSLLEDFTATAGSISEAAGVSPATAFRRRGEVLRRGLIMPRARVDIPALSERICCLASTECAGSLVHAFRCLPLTCQSILHNLEDNTTKKVLFTAALPAGAGRGVIQVLNEEVSKAYDFKAFKISAATIDGFKVSKMFDSKKRTWRWSSDMLDVRNYGKILTESSVAEIPVDLA